MVTFFTLMTLPLIKYKWSNKTDEKLSGIISREICPPNELSVKPTQLCVGFKQKSNNKNQPASSRSPHRHPSTA